MLMKIDFMFHSDDAISLYLMVIIGIFLMIFSLFLFHHGKSLGLGMKDNRDDKRYLLGAIFNYIGGIISFIIGIVLIIIAIASFF